MSNKDLKIFKILILKDQKNIFNCLCIPSSTNLSLEQIRFISEKNKYFYKK